MVEPAVEGELVFAPTPKQDEFISAVLSGQYRELFYGGAVGGGKSYLACALLVLFCKMWPGSRWALVRKDLPTMRRNTIPTFAKVRPSNFVGEINQSTWAAECSNGSQILFFTESIEQDPELYRWRGLEVNGFFLEEANELTEKSYYKAIERRGRWHIDGLKDQPPPLIIGTCNPSKNWVKRLFFDPWKMGVLKAPKFYLPAYTTDNPHLSAEYIEGLKALPEREYDTFVKGNWDTADEPDQLIKSEWVEEAFKRGEALLAAGPIVGAQRLGVDPARYGDDDSGLARMVQVKPAIGTPALYLTELEGFHGVDTYRLAGLVRARAVEHQIKPHNVRVDTVGLGAGVADALWADGKGWKCCEFIAGAKPIEGAHKFLTFRNLRSQAWWHYRDLLKDGHAAINPALRTHAKFIADLVSPRYSVDSDKVIEVEAKDEIKKRLGRSTDYGDAVVMGAAKMSAAADYLAAITTR